MIRLFVGIPLPEDAGVRLHALAGGVPGARWIPPENMHLTLRFIGNVDELTSEDIDHALTTVRSPAFDLTIGGLGQFATGRRPSMLWAGVERNPALSHLQERIEAVLVRAGLAPEPRKFTPHVTLARLKHAPRARVQTFIAANNLIRLTPFRVDAFTLFSSFLAHTGALYRAEAVYPLDPAAVGGDTD